MDIKGGKSKVEENKQEKETKLLKAAFELFTEKGIKRTSVQDIVDKAGLAKGTFYLYFKDKYELQDRLIANKSKQLFDDALVALAKSEVSGFEKQLIFIIDYVINALNKNRLLLKFISKNLSWGLYNEKLSKIVDDNALGVHQLFIDAVNQYGIKLKNPGVTLYMIIELVSATCFSSIINKQPLPIEEYKVYLYDAISKTLKDE